MAQPQQPMGEVIAPDTSHLITDDGAPLESFLAEKQARLLTEPLRSSWCSPNGKPFIAAANVGVFAVPRNPAIVPDVFLSLDVELGPIAGPDRVRSYFVWEFGKPPDVVIEIVSDTPGDELSDKLRQYERMRVAHYVVFDPHRVLGKDELTAFVLEGNTLVARDGASFADIGLGLRRWRGQFEDMTFDWLRWCHFDGSLIQTGKERAEAEAQRAEAEAQRAEAEAQRAEAEARRADRLAARLRELGIDPDADE